MDHQGLSIDCGLHILPGSFAGAFVAIHSAAEHAEAEADPVGFAAKRLGCAREVLGQYVESEGCLQCDEVTRRGRRCQNRTPMPVELQDWLRGSRGGWKCRVHS